MYDGRQGVNTAAIQLRNGLNSAHSKLISSVISFKECVNLLHYCRLVYKYVTFLKSMRPNEDNQIRVLSSWVLAFIDDIKGKIN